MMLQFMVMAAVMLFSSLLAGQEKKTDNASILPLVGNWEGAIQANALELRLGFDIKADGTGMMFSIDQGNAKIPVSKVTSTPEVSWKMPSVQASFSGKLNEKGDIIDGIFMQGPAKLPLQLKKVATLTKLNRPQEPKPPFPYRAEEVSYESVPGKVKLAGTLTIPQGNGPFPAVLLITGSGPQDRDEELLGHKPFLVLADYLTRRGIAVLRVDDRGVKKSTGNFLTATTFDFADDAQAGVNFLKTRSEVNHARIGLIGHSEGGVIAPIVATKTSDVAFIVLMAGTGLPGDEIIYRQGRLIAQAMGAKKENVDRGEAIQRKLFTVIKAEKPSQELVKKLKTLYQELTANLTEAEKKELDKAGGDAAMEAQLSTFAQPWFKTFLTHDPRPVLGQVKCPVLAINGELDLQVPCKENLDNIQKALADAGHQKHTIKSFAKVNHLFQRCETGAPSEYGKLEETISPEVLQTIGDWITSLNKQ